MTNYNVEILFGGKTIELFGSVGTFKEAEDFVGFLKEIEYIKFRWLDDNYESIDDYAYHIVSVEEKTLSEMMNDAKNSVEFWKTERAFLPQFDKNRGKKG